MAAGLKAGWTVRRATGGAEAKGSMAAGSEASLTAGEAEVEGCMAAYLKVDPVAGGAIAKGCIAAGLRLEIGLVFRRRRRKGHIRFSLAVAAVLPLGNAA